MNGDRVIRSLIYGTWRHGAGGGRWFFRFWRGRRSRQAEAQHDPRADSEVVLARIAAQTGTRKIGHEVIQLHKAPGYVLAKDHVHAAASRQREGALITVSGDLRSAMRSSNQELCEWHKIVEAPHVQPGAKQPGAPSRLNGVAIYIAAEVVPIQFRN